MRAFTPALATEEIPQLTLVNYVPKIKYKSGNGAATADGRADETVEQEEGELVGATTTPSYAGFRDLLPVSMVCCVSLKTDSA